MSQVSPTRSTFSSTFQSVLNAALERYEDKTKYKLLTHPLAAQIQSCDSPAAIHGVLEGIVQRFDERRRNDERLTKWLDPTVEVLYSFSCAVGSVGGLVSVQMTASQERGPDHPSFLGLRAGQCNLCRDRRSLSGEDISMIVLIRTVYIGVAGTKAAKEADTSQDVLCNLFVRMENFFRRLESYTEVPPTPPMLDIIVKIMVEVLTILAIATIDLKRRRASEWDSWPVCRY
jgi:hypothetical protein